MVGRKESNQTNKYHLVLRDFHVILAHMHTKPTVHLSTFTYKTPEPQVMEQYRWNENLTVLPQADTKSFH